MARGRKPQSNAEKKRKGETRPSQQTVTVIEFPKIKRLPDPPDWVNDEGKTLWKRTGPLLFAQGLLTIPDLDALAHLCQLHGSIVDFIRRGIVPSAAELAQLRLYFAEFGLTPTSRTRVGGTDGPKQNPFKRNGPRPTP